MLLLAATPGLKLAHSHFYITKTCARAAISQSFLQSERDRLLKLKNALTDARRSTTAVVLDVYDQCARESVKEQGGMSAKLWNHGSRRHCVVIVTLRHDENLSGPSRPTG